MDKAILILVYFLMFVWSVYAASKFCLVTSDCSVEKCCEGICLSRKTCSGLCYFSSDCDRDYGESCIRGKCQCVRPPCTQETIDDSTSKSCIDDSQCTKNESCQNGICQRLDSITKPKPMDPVVLGVVATVGLIIFASAFFLCLRKQHSSRPSLAAKEAQHQAVERARTNEQNVQVNTVGESSDTSHEKRHQNSGKKRNFKGKGSHKKPPITSPASLIELSAIIEEDEISEIASK